MVGADRIRVFDSVTASAAIAMLGLAIQRRLERGTTDEEIEQFVARYEPKVGLLFTVDTLEFLAKGGRIGRAAALAGQLLNVKPFLTIIVGRGVPSTRGLRRTGPALVVAGAAHPSPPGGARATARHAAGRRADDPQAAREAGTRDGRRPARVRALPVRAGRAGAAHRRLAGRRGGR